MQGFAQLAFELRVLLLILAGLASGAFANYLIYTWAYFPRHISPFAPPHPQAPPRRWTDRLPVLGWLGLRRESELHGRGFWIRPLLIELLLPVALIAIYWYENTKRQVVARGAAYSSVHRIVQSWAHTLFLVHAIMFVLMVAATFIDFDEQTIPDIITTPGTWFALIVSMLPWSTWLPSTVYWNNQLGMTETTSMCPGHSMTSGEVALDYSRRSRSGGCGALVC